MKSLPLLCFVSIVSAQNFIWTWVHGSSEINRIGNYSIKGSPSPGLYPRARSYHDGVLHPLTDLFVIFGGIVDGSNTALNDLWTFDYALFQWTWLSGSNQVNRPGVYGTRGRASIVNVPGSRYSMGMDIHPVSGLLVVFGGYAFGFDGSRAWINDLWTFNFTINSWTWISGSTIPSQGGVYGTKGEPAPSNVPGARDSCILRIHPTSGDVIMFGGYGPPGLFNDLWSYNMNTALWTWLSGSSSTNQAGVYGNKGVESTENGPGARNYLSSAINTNNGNLLIFGGGGGYFNDLWSYNFTSNRWTWLSGETTTNSMGSYGTKNVSSPTNVPSSRNAHKMVFAPRLNILVLFGGRRYLQSTNYDLNDVWIYNITSDQWTWVRGSSLTNQPGFYGSKGVPDEGNSPGGRGTFLFVYYDKLQKCLLHGGLGYSSSSYGMFDDIWTLDLPIEGFPTQASSTSEATAEVAVTPSTTHPPELDSSTSRETESALDSSSDQIQVILSDPELGTSTRKSASGPKTTFSKNQQVSNFFEQNMTLLMFTVVIFLVLCTCLLIFYTFKRKKPTKRGTTESKVTDTNSSTLTKYSKNTTSFSNFSTTSTNIPTNQGISVPGYLQVKFGVDFRIRGEIARGGCGSVCLAEALNAKLRIYDTNIIVKLILKQHLTERDIQLFYQEVSLMHYLNEHKNIAKILGYTEGPPCLLMKFYQYGSLDGWLHEASVVKTRRWIFKLLIDISRGVEHMHSKDLVHCDLKPQNVLLDIDDDGLFCVLTDFGITQIVSDKNLLVKAFNVVNVRGASVAFAAPEALLRMRKCQDILGTDLFRCDVYSVGIIIYEMLTRIDSWAIQRK